MDIVNPACQTLENRDLDMVPITPDEYNHILDIQNKILRMIASHDQSEDILARLCLLAEELLPNSVASIMLVDDTTGLMSVISAPSIPQVGHDALENLQPGVGGGSCGNAVFRNEAQYVQDTFKDDRWSDLRQVAYDFNLCSCWSMPVRKSDKKPIGTFALSSFEHRSPAPFHKKLLETAASIVNIVLKNRENEKRIKLFSSAMQNATEGMVITDADNHIIEVNAAFERVYDIKEADIIGKNPNYFSSGKHPQSFYKDLWNDLINKSTWSGEVTNRRLDGKEIQQWMSITAFKNQDENTESYLAIFTDLTELKKIQNQLGKMAYSDSLTGLYSKANLEQKLEQEIDQTLIILNVDNFSYINMAYGFEVGDKLLIKIASTLKDACGTPDIFRINSDEFAILFNKKLRIREKVNTIKELFYGFEIDIDDIKLNISFSYGAAYGNNHLFRNSTLALKKAQESGKNSLYIFNKDDDVSSHTVKFMASNNLLHKALQEDRVVPYFQGIRNNKTGEITKFESLVRIHKGDLVVSPSEFIETAKLSGLLPDITKVMIDKTFKIMSNNDFTFSINITEDDLNKDYLTNYLKEKSTQYNIKSSRLILEILEGISTGGKNSHIQQITKLKSMGYTIAIDDFGSEYSNFERVLDLDIDFLKIDAKYIKDIHTNPKSYEITKAIAYFAKNANIPCIAEFVHNEEVQNIIIDLEIEFSQGYYFSQPVPLPTLNYL